MDQQRNLLFVSLSEFKKLQSKKEIERPVVDHGEQNGCPRNTPQPIPLFQVGHEPALISGSAIRANGRVLHVAMSHSLVHSSASCSVHYMKVDFTTAILAGYMRCAEDMTHLS
ncbi:unnamed protein product, partial [Musa textilis]